MSYDPEIHDPYWNTAGNTDERAIQRAMNTLSYNRLTQDQADRIKAYAQARVGQKVNLLDAISRAAATLDGLTSEVDAAAAVPTKVRHQPTVAPISGGAQATVAPDQSAMNVLSLFAGIGGLELGLERAGMTTVGQVEIDPFCRQVLARHWPGVPQHDDVRTAVEWWQSEPRSRVDVVCGGFPCQPFSNAGYMRGIGDERWAWPWMEAVIRGVRPGYVLVENVSALVRDDRAFGTVLRDLHTLGFDAEWATLRASDFGAPTPRERVYLLAYATGEYGQSRHRVGQGRDRATPLSARGLLGLDAHSRRRAASEWLEREPRVDRLANGIPRQVDRLRVIGNAVVPAVAEHIGRQLMDHVRAVAA